MALLNEKGFERKLQQMSLAQDSVQTVSLWIIHHKKYAGDIVKVWTENLKKCSPDRRLVLFYLANDVLQNSRKKGKEFSTAFSKVLKDVIPLLCERKICDSVQRVMKIWHERKVFDKEFLDSLQRKFEASQVKAAKVHKVKTSHLDSDAEHGTPKHESKQSTSQKAQEKKLPPADFKPTQMIDALKAMRDLQAEVTLKESQLNSLRIDASDVEAIKQLKDRATGAKFTSEYEAASEKLESFCGTLKRQREETLKLIQCLEDGRLFYDSAFGEVKVIVHAYKTFGNRLNSLKKKVDHKVAKIINAEAEKKKMGPIHTPQASFLTSGLPNIAADEEKSPEAADPTVDNTEVADMDIEDDGDSENDDSSQSPTESTSTPTSDVKTTEAPASKANTETKTSATASTPSSVSSSVTTTFSSSTSSVASVPVQMTAVHPQVMMQQPHMPFLPGQPGMPMIPVGMPGSGQFISIPSQYPQPLVPYGMGMHALGSFPGQPQLTRLPLPSQTTFPGVVPNIPQQIPGNAPASQMAVNTNTLTPVRNPSSQQNHSGVSSTTTSVVPLAQPIRTINTNTDTVPTQAVSQPLTSSKLTSIESSARQSIGSPASEMSAPSPVGSPELELGGDETPETASPQRVDDVKIIAMSEQQPVQGELPGTSEEASAPSTGSTTPNRGSEMSKPVSAVNILAQLISRGRQLKEQSSDIECQSGASTPKEDPPTTTQSKQEKPLFSLIDSLFPKLTDSLKTIREREKDNETSTSTSEEGSPKQKIEINSMGDNDDSENEGDRMIRSQQHVPEGEHRGPMGFHPTDFGHGNARGPFTGHPQDGPHVQEWNEENFSNHRPPFREYQERPQIPPQSPVKGPGLSPRFPGPQRAFPVPPGTFYGPPETDPVGEPVDDFRGMSHRSPRQIHSPRAQFNRPVGHEFEMNNGPPNNRPQIRPISPRGSLVGGDQSQGFHERTPHFEEILAEEQRPQFHFENPGAPPRPVGPPEVHRMPLGGSPPRPNRDGRPRPRWLNPEGPRGSHPHREGPPFHRSFSEGERGEVPGEPPMKRQMLEEGPPRPFMDQGPPTGFRPSSPLFERNREMWSEREQWEPRHPAPDRTRPEFRSREGHLSPRFVEHGNRPFPPHQERPSFPARRNSFKGFDHREHFPEHRPRPRFPFRGGHQRPFY